MIFAGFSELEQRDDVAAFFKDKDVKLTGGPRIVSQVAESISLNHALKVVHQGSLIEFLQSQ
jgi:hypothetical protein